MSTGAALRGLSREQRNTFIASFLGWTLDAFDFFLVVVVLRHVATDLKSTLEVASIAVTLTLAMRPLGALIFGWCADRYGRRLPLMIDVGLYSIIELATAFSPNIAVFIVLRAIYGIAMGGEWGLGAALAMESLPPAKRGTFSGILQEGYAVGYILAAAVFGLLFTHIGWRGMFAIGTAPALLIFYIRSHVPESPVWLAARTSRPQRSTRILLSAIAKNFPLFLYSIVFLAAFNAMSHGTQDPYVSAFLEGAHRFDAGTASWITIVTMIGALCGGIVWGSISQRLGRRNTMMICGLLGLLLIPLWAFGHTVAVIAAGGFMMQFAVQGAWGIIPAHLNEISPPEVRATFPGFTYQLGNLIASPVLTLEVLLAKTQFGSALHPNYPAALAASVAVILASVVVLTGIGYFTGPEHRERPLAGTAEA